MKTSIVESGAGRFHEVNSHVYAMGLPGRSRSIETHSVEKRLGLKHPRQEPRRSNVSFAKYSVRSLNGTETLCVLGEE